LQVIFFALSAERGRGGRGTGDGERCSFLFENKKEPKKKLSSAKCLRRGESLPLEGEGGPLAVDEVD